MIEELENEPVNDEKLDSDQGCQTQTQDTTDPGTSPGTAPESPSSPGGSPDQQEETSTDTAQVTTTTTMRMKDDEQQRQQQQRRKRERFFFELAKQYIPPTRFFCLIMRLYAERKLLVVMGAHSMASLCVWIHFFLVKWAAQAQLLESKSATPDNTPLYWMQRIVPAIEFGTMHVVLLQLALLPLTMCRYTIANLSNSNSCNSSSSLLNSIIPLHRVSTDIHYYLGYLLVTLVSLASLLFLAFFGVLCRSGQTAFCAKFTSEIMITGYVLWALLLVVAVTSYFRSSSSSSSSTNGGGRTKAAAAGNPTKRFFPSIFRLSYEAFYNIHHLVFVFYILCIMHTLDNTERNNIQMSHQQAAAAAAAGAAPPPIAHRSQSFPWVTLSLLYYLCDRMTMRFQHKYTARLLRSSTVTEVPPVPVAPCLPFDQKHHQQQQQKLAEPPIIQNVVKEREKDEPFEIDIEMERVEKQQRQAQQQQQKAMLLQQKRCFSNSTSTNSNNSSSSNNGGRMVLLTLHRPILFSFQPGQYSFLRWKEIDDTWHPFSIASSPSSHVLEFYVAVIEQQQQTDNDNNNNNDKSSSSWTAKLSDRLQQIAALRSEKSRSRSSKKCKQDHNDDCIEFEIMGPYGTGLPVQPGHGADSFVSSASSSSSFSSSSSSQQYYSHAILIGSGTGIVPLLSLMKQHIRHLCVHYADPDTHAINIKRQARYVTLLETASRQQRKGSLAEKVALSACMRSLIHFVFCRGSSGKHLHDDNDNDDQQRHLLLLQLEQQRLQTQVIRNRQQPQKNSPAKTTTMNRKEEKKIGGEDDISNCIYFDESSSLPSSSAVEAAASPDRIRPSRKEKQKRTISESFQQFANSLATSVESQPSSSSSNHHTTQRLLSAAPTQQEQQQQQSTKEMEHASLAASRSIYGVVLLGILPVIGVFLIGIGISWNLLTPQQIKPGMTEFLQTLTIYFQVLFAIISIFIWDACDIYTYMDFVASCGVSPIADYFWFTKYARGSSLSHFEIALNSLLIGYMTARLWLMTVRTRHQYWKGGAAEGSGTLERLEIVWTTRSASFVSEILPEIEKHWNRLVAKWGIKRAKVVCRISIYVTDKDRSAILRLKRELRQDSALYKIGWVHFERPEFYKAIENHSLEMISTKQYSSTLLAFCGSSPLAQLIHQYKISNDMVLAITGNKKHQMEFISDSYSGFKRGKEAKRGAPSKNSTSRSGQKQQLQLNDPTHYFHDEEEGQLKGLTTRKIVSFGDRKNDATESNVHVSAFSLGVGRVSDLGCGDSDDEYDNELS